MVGDAQYGFFFLGNLFTILKKEDARLRVKADM